MFSGWQGPNDKGTIHIFSMRVRVAGEDATNEQHTLEGPLMDHQNSSGSIDLLIQTNIGSNASSSLSFMRDMEKGHAVQEETCTNSLFNPFNPLTLQSCRRRNIYVQVV